MRSSNPLFQRLLPYLESKGKTGATRRDMETFLGQVATLGAASMVERRVSSYIQWLVKLDLATMSGTRLALKPLPAAVPLIRYEADDEPISPNRYELEEYEEQAQRVATRREAVAYFVDQAKHERAYTSHETLVRLMAERLRQHGAMPKANRYIDLSARLDGTNYLFEMKSTTEDNPHSQVRRGLSQLYEYRYVQKIENPCLVLVMENPLPRRFQWLADYLVQDRDILLVWDGNGQFSCPEAIADRLPFLS